MPPESGAIPDIAVDDPAQLRAHLTTIRDVTAEPWPLTAVSSLIFPDAPRWSARQ